jgi:hypothetical protein
MTTRQHAADPPQPEQATITDPHAVALVTDRTSLRFLAPFLEGPQTLTSAATALDRPRSSVAYWVPQFLQAGLIVRLADAIRRGPPMPRYRAVARQLAIPLRVLPLDRRVAFLDSGRHRLLRLFLDGLDEVLSAERGAALGVAAAGTGDGAAAITFIEPAARAQRRPYTDAWHVLRLDRSDAEALAEELEAVIERYAGRRGVRRYVVHAGLAAEPKVRWRSAEDRPLR